MPRLLLPLLVFLAFLAAPALTNAWAQDQGDQMLGPPPGAAPTRHIDVQQLAVLDATPAFDPARATAAYLAKVSGPERARSDAYFEGNYWLLLVNLVWTLVVSGLILWLGAARTLRDWAAEKTHSRASQSVIFALGYVAIMAAAEFPLTVYEDYFREHDFGLSNQDFIAWLSDYGTGLGLVFLSALILAPLLYWLIRRTHRNWWLWGAGLTILFQIVVAVIFPVFVAPLFNHYAPLPPSPLKTQILSLARANDIPADNVYVADESRQSNRISANVSGFLGTTRISLNDNLLSRGTPDEVLAVLGHEMGHYVMGHMTRLILLGGLVTIAAFLFMHWGFIFLTELFGGQWQVRRVEDIAGLPLLVALGTLFYFLATPLSDTISRTTEHQADIFGLDAVRKPDAFATAMLKLSPYRKLEPGRWEEIIFYDHPSGRTRIMDAMVWKQEHIKDPDIRDTVSPEQK